MMNTEFSEDKATRKQRSPWEIMFGLSGLFAVLATLVVALITYNQNLKIQALQAAASAESDKSKSQSALVVQKTAGETAITETQLKTALDKQLGELTDDRERSLSARDLEMKKYINDENVRLGRYSKESDANLKLVDIATELLRSDSTQSNLELRRWAVDIVNSHSNVKMTKAATAEAIAAAITGEPVRVFIESKYAKNNEPTNGCSVLYRRPGTEAAFRFPALTRNGESGNNLSKGPYEFWVDCGFAKSEKQQFFADKSDPPLHIEFTIPPPQR
jgi:hypothetical protein